MIALLASSSVVNKVTLESDFVFKQRLWYAELLRIPGNLFLRIRKAPVKVLSRKQWQQRECEIANATITNGSLKLQRIPGVTLAEYLRSDRGSDQKSNAVFVAIHALLELHRDHQQTHGDASAANVMIHELPGDEIKATWFDFDVAHVGPFASLNRADDLRAILTTSGEKLEDVLNMLPETEAIELKSAYRELEKTLSIDVFHLSQRIRVLGLFPRKKENEIRRVIFRQRDLH